LVHSFHILELAVWLLLAQGGNWLISNEGADFDNK
jgi:hypothetical protein